MSSAHVQHLKHKLDVKTAAAQQQQQQQQQQAANNANGGTATPAEDKGLLDRHHVRVRSQAERERKQAEVARKMAARFNLTYRALALSPAKMAAEQRERDLKAAREAKAAAARYQMTARALKMSATGTAKGKVNVMNHAADVAAGKAAAAAATKDDDRDLSHLAGFGTPSPAQQQQQQAPPPSDASSAKDDEAMDALSPLRNLSINRMDSADDDNKTLVSRAGEDDDGRLSRITEATREHTHEEHDAFWMPQLALGVAKKDDNLINEAVVRAFLEEHDPERVAEVPALLAAHKGREHQLMEALNEQYPPAHQLDGASDDNDASSVVYEPETPKAGSSVLQVHVGASGVPVVDARKLAFTEGGFILGGVKDPAKDALAKNSENSRWSVGRHTEEQQRLLRDKMKKQGVDAATIEAVVTGGGSEML